MLSHVRTAALWGLEALPVECEVDVGPGLPGFVLVGLPAAATERAKGTGNTLGEANAPVTMEVYADFQCPACGQFDRTTLKEIEDKYVKNGKL